MTFSYTDNIDYNLPMDVFPSYTSNTLPGFGSDGSNPYFPSDGGFSYDFETDYDPFEDSPVDPPSFGDLPRLMRKRSNSSTAAHQDLLRRNLPYVCGHIYCLATQHRR